tara:strand:+ start:1586 stop:2710 length:1125 start_codon:yes stop_codon:yes gene_type:complete
MQSYSKQTKPKTYFIVAGEPSGDLHGAKLIAAIKKLTPDASFVGLGGDKMKKEGFETLYHTDQLSVMGFSEIINHLPFFLKALRVTAENIISRKPDKIILIDYPGFNLRLAKKCSSQSIPISYFILPQLWAWKESRIKFFHKYIDQALCIFPFEQSWFEKRGVATNYVGHPFTEDMRPKLSKIAFYQKHGISKEKKILTLIPGSRQQEVDKLWPVYYRSAIKIQEHNDIEIVVAKGGGVVLPRAPGCHIEENDTYAAMAYATASITTSGTASLECAVLDTPQVVCYRVSWASGVIAKLMNRAAFISMPNLIAEKQVVGEYLQKEVNPTNIIKAITPLLSDTPQRKKMLQDFEQIRRSLGLPGAYERAAKSIIVR